MALSVYAQAPPGPGPGPGNATEDNMTSGYSVSNNTELATFSCYDPGTGIPSSGGYYCIDRRYWCPSQASSCITLNCGLGPCTKCCY